MQWLGQWNSSSVDTYNMPPLSRDRVWPDHRSVFRTLSLSWLDIMGEETVLKPHQCGGCFIHCVLCCVHCVLVDQQASLQQRLGHTHIHSDTHTHTHTHARARTHTHTHTHTQRLCRRHSMKKKHICYLCWSVRTKKSDLWGSFLPFLWASMCRLWL